ncbi:50S ribosomal protein L17 [Candidatus Collierbacteria bacterium]|nr:50S ribosomal protein L17 [Candidatus Collierbacteria bacterium]
MKFSRSYNQRKALFRGLLSSLIAHGQITTTVSKAKITKRQFDKLLSQAKDKNLASRRLLIAKLGNARTANRLVDVIAPLYSTYKGGYTSLQNVAVRRGDNAVMAQLKLTVDLPAAKVAETAEKNKIKKAEKTKAKVEKATSKVTTKKTAVKKEK